MVAPQLLTAFLEQASTRRRKQRIVKVSSPREHPVTRGFLCVKGRFGYEFMHGANRRQRRVEPGGSG